MGIAPKTPAPADATAESLLLIATKQDGMDRRLTTMAGEMSVLQGDVAVLKGDVAVLKGDVAVLKGDVAVLKDDVAELKDDVAELKDDVKDLKQGQAVLIDNQLELKRGVDAIMAHLGIKGP